MAVLSVRECEILVRIGNGRTDRQIFQKLEVPTRAAAVAKALILGLIEL